VHRPGRRLRADPTAPVAGLEGERPEWRAWLALVAEVRRALDRPAWATLAGPAHRAAAGAEGPGARAPSGPEPDPTPRLHGRTVEVDAARAQRFVGRLVARAAAAAEAAGTGAAARSEPATGIAAGSRSEAAAGAGAGPAGDGAPRSGDGASLRRFRPPPAQVVALLQAAVAHDRPAIEAIAGAGVDPVALAAVADLAALPLLHPCARALAADLPRYWPHGYCPVCAAWPLLAERRGLDRTRRLRCGRCGADWQAEWLRCTYCGEREHRRLGSLVPEERGDTLVVETCESCRGYLKSFTTLEAIPPLELLLRDLETVELDLVALERGYTRPAGLGFALDVRVAARRPGLLSRLRRDA